MVATAIFNTLDHDAAKVRVREMIGRYADFLREHPSGFTPSPSRRQQKLLAAEAARAAAVEAPTLPPPPGEPAAGEPAVPS